MMKRSTPYSTPSPPSGAKLSTTSWTIPEPGDVLSYAYLWHHEAVSGQEEGLKDRPVVVVVAHRVVSGRTEFLVAPITHSPPEQETHAILMPQSVKRHLGLDHDNSWIVVTELNRFLWPGPDIRPTRDAHDGTPLYGPIPAWLFEKVKVAVLSNSKARSLAITKRTD